MDNAEVSTPGIVATVVAPTARYDPDTLLVKQYLRGDVRAFEVLFKKYQAPIFNLVSRMVNGEDAYDLTQDVFCQALRALHSFRGEAKFSTWLYSIARNVCLNHLRHNSCIQQDSIEEMSEDNAFFELPDNSADVEEIAETHELQRIVNSVLAMLTPEQRLLITLRDFEQLSYDEISFITEISLSNVKSRLHRARIAFKERFKPYLKLLREGCWNEV